MDQLRETSFGAPSPQRDAPLDLAEPAGCPTPGEVIGQIARVIVVCLALGLLARVMVALIGVH